MAKNMMKFEFWFSRVNRTLKDTLREKAPSNKTPALTKSTTMGIWVVVHQISSL